MTDTATTTQATEIPDRRPLHAMLTIRKAISALWTGVELVFALPTLALILAAYIAFAEKLPAEEFVPWLIMQLELFSAPIGVLLIVMAAVASLLMTGIVVLFAVAYVISNRWQALNPEISVFDAAAREGEALTMQRTAAAEARWLASSAEVRAANAKLRAAFTRPRA